MGKKQYNPQKQYNPIVQAKKIEELKERTDRLGKNIKALSKSNDDHIAFLANFTRHDIKNAILSMDSILTVTTPEEFTHEKITSLSTYLEVISNTIENFAKLVPYSSNGKFKLETLFVAIEVLTRADMQNHKVDFQLKFDRNLPYEMKLPFQALLQMINNLLLNSLKALEEIDSKKILLEGFVEDDFLIIRISDNANPIPDCNVDNIFLYGFSTTGGSGIGLYHAKYLCEELEGSISVTPAQEEVFTKTFCITLPIKKDGKASINN